MKTPAILIVDDEKKTRDTIRDFLTFRIKCNIHEAEDGEDALRKLKDNDIDVMLLDIRMPKKNGILVLDEMKALNKDVNTIVITAWDSDLVAEECAKRNVECIPKPLTLSELYNKITKLLIARGQHLPL
ncbi:MAG: response regulator [Candidatus Omnitrophota bacterium]